MSHNSWVMGLIDWQRSKLNYQKVQFINTCSCTFAACCCENRSADSAAGSSILHHMDTRWVSQHRIQSRFVISAWWCALLREWFVDGCFHGVHCKQLPLMGVVLSIVWPFLCHCVCWPACVPSCLPHMHLPVCFPTLWGVTCRSVLLDTLRAPELSELQASSSRCQGPTAGLPPLECQLPPCFVPSPTAPAWSCPASLPCGYWKFLCWSHLYLRWSSLLASVSFGRCFNQDLHSWASETAVLLCFHCGQGRPHSCSSVFWLHWCFEPTVLLAWICSWLLSVFWCCVKYFTLKITGV